jgi:vacuolar-type H+-ATPase subunit I/STV1
MPLFGRKRKEEIQEVKQTIELPTLEKIMNGMKRPIEKRPVEKLVEKIPETEKVTVEKIPEQHPKEIKEEVKEKSSFAPLFVKLDRYRQILNTMNYLKNTMNMIKNTLSILNELEKIKSENLKLIEDTIEKADKKILTLDSEFMRPSGFIEEMPELSDVESLEATLVDLREQVNQLKSELRSMA